MRRPALSSPTLSSPTLGEEAGVVTLIVLLAEDRDDPHYYTGCSRYSGC